MASAIVASVQTRAAARLSGWRRMLKRAATPAPRRFAARCAALHRPPQPTRILWIWSIPANALARTAQRLGQHGMKGQHEREGEANGPPTRARPSTSHTPATRLPATNGAPAGSYRPHHMPTVTQSPMVSSDGTTGMPARARGQDLMDLHCAMVFFALGWCYAVSQRAIYRLAAPLSTRVVLRASF